MKRYCYWSLATGDYAKMFAATIRSARECGVFKDFHVWSDQVVPGAVCHEAGPVEKWGCLFKLTYLRDAVSKLDYEYFVWLDTDTWFVRNPGDVLRVLRGSPIHVALESDLSKPENRRRDWWECPNMRFVELMHRKGVRSRSVFNVNGGFFIVHREVVSTLYNLAHEFWEFSRGQGFTFNDEPLLAYAMHMLCGNPYAHTIRQGTDLWASDWTGCFADALPDGLPWWFVDYFTEEKRPVNPGIVHAMRSKKALLEAASPAYLGLAP